MTILDEDAVTRADRHSAFAPESTPWHHFPIRRAERQDREGCSDDWLGPHPRQTVEMFHDLGLDDDEIARYFGSSLQRIKRLSDGGARPEGARSLGEVARLVRAKIFGGTIR